MANKYTDILNITANGKNQMGLSNTIKRDYGIPLDFSSVQENYNAAVLYAATSTLAYVGQPISIGDKLYIITETAQGKHTIGEQEYDVFLTEVGSATEGDGKTITLKDGILSLAGIDGKATGTYVPSLINGVLTWNEPDTSTAEGQQQAIDALETRADALELTVNGKPADEEAGTDAIKGLVEKVADNAAAIAAEVTSRETAITNEASARSEAIKAVTDSIGTVTEGKTVVEMIADAETAAKAAIPTAVSSFTNDANYQNATEVSQAITTAIAGKANSADVYTKTEVDGFVDTLEDAISNITHFTTKIVDSVDDVTEVGVLYLIKDADVAGVDKYNEYLFIDGAAVLIGDTTTDLSDYVTTNALETELAKYTTIEGLTTVLAPYAKTDDVNTALEGKVDVATYNIDKATFALEESVASRLNEKADKSSLDNYYTKTAADELLGTKADAEATTNALATKVETAQIRHTSEGVGEGVTKDGTALTITVDTYTKSEVYTKSETDAAITAKINSVTGGESAADVKLALEDYRDAVNTEIWGSNAGSWTTRTTEDGKTVVEYVPQYGTTSRIDTLETKVASAETNIQTAQNAADAAALAVTTLENGQVKTNKESIAALTNIIQGTSSDDKNGLSYRIGVLETANSTHAAEYNALNGKVDTLTTAVTVDLPKAIANAQGDATYARTVLDGTDGEAGLVAVVASKANASEVYKKAEVDALVEAVEITSGEVVHVDSIDDFEGIEISGNKITVKVDTCTKLEIDSIGMTAQDAYDLALNHDQTFVELAGPDHPAETGKASFPSIREIAADEINTLINAADPEGGKTIENLTNLVKYVDENAGEIAALVTATGDNTAKLADVTGTVGNAIEAAKQAAIEAARYTLHAATEDALGGIKSATGDNKVSVDADGIASVASVNVNTLTQTEGDILILDGGKA